MELTIYEASIFTIPRIAQMTQKTNQFNLTTFRYTEDDIKNKIFQYSSVGSNGLTIFTSDNANLNFVDSFAICGNVSFFG